MENYKKYVNICLDANQMLYETTIENLHLLAVNLNIFFNVMGVELFLICPFLLFLFAFCLLCSNMVYSIEERIKIIATHCPNNECATGVLRILKCIIQTSVRHEYIEQLMDEIKELKIFRTYLENFQNLSDM